MSGDATPLGGPALSADVVPLLVGDDGHVRVLLSRRQFEPDLGELALPGVLILAGETVEEACHRALATKSGVTADQVRSLRLAWLADSPVRDERGHTISVAYLAVVADEGQTALASNEAFAPADVPRALPFDHSAIIDGALDRAREWLWADRGALARDLLGDRFTGSRAATTIGDLDPTFNTTNTPRLLASKRFLHRAAATATTGRGRPSTTWEFDDA